MGIEDEYWVPTPLPPMTNETWDIKQDRVQEEIISEIDVYLAERNTLMEQALPKWVVSLVRRYGVNRWTTRILSLSIMACRICTDEVHVPPNKKVTTIRRGRRVVGIAVLDVPAVVESCRDDVAADEAVSLNEVVSPIGETAGIDETEGSGQTKQSRIQHRVARASKARARGAGTKSHY